MSRGRARRTYRRARPSTCLRNFDDVYAAVGVIGVFKDPSENGFLVCSVGEADACALTVDDERVDSEDDVGAVVQDRATRVTKAGATTAFAWDGRELDVEAGSVCVAGADDE